MLRVLFTRLVAPWVWAKPQRAASLLLSFSRAERSSMLDMLAAARATPSDTRRAQYLTHALDEERHARTFFARARELRDGRVSTDENAADFDALYERLGETGFVAYVHRGERRGRAQFEQHRSVLRARGDEQGARLFEAILVDEARHEAYTHALLLELAGSEASARAALRKAALREALWTWRRAGRNVSGLLFTIATSLLFLLLAPLHLLYRNRKKPGWITRGAR